MDHQSSHVQPEIKAFLALQAKDKDHYNASLRAALGLFDRSWELIVVDNGSTDKTAWVVREFIKTVNLRATYLFEPMRGKSKGLNTALETVSGQIVNSPTMIAILRPTS
jgi:cellulose synthase/poly-beta-1,6-N-acetylglucosamine synthase-like glycosyltransferase